MLTPQERRAIQALLRAAQRMRRQLDLSDRKAVAATETQLFDEAVQDCELAGLVD